MKVFKPICRIVSVLCGTLVLAISLVHAEDIDIFVGNSTVDSGLPNVIFVLDNTANWSRQSQGWPNGTQGQSEVRVITAALADLEDRVNVGLVMFTTEGNANQDGGYVRHHLQKLTPASRSSLETKLKSIEDNINAPVEKRSANTAFGNLMYDTYNYLVGGTQSYDGAGTPNLADSLHAYTSNYSTFASPLTSESACGKTYLIFIGNPNSSGPTGDSSTNSTKLKDLYATATAGVASAPDGLAGSSGAPAPLPLPGFKVTTTVSAQPTVLEGQFSSACYAPTEGAKQGQTAIAGPSACTVAESATSAACLQATSDGGTCECTVTPKDQGACPKFGSTQTYKLGLQLAGTSITTVEETGTSNTTAGRAWNLDDWAKFLNQQGVPITLSGEGGDFQQRIPVITYTIDVFNKQQNADHSALLFSAARAGGGRYFQAKDEKAIVDAIQNALSDILSVSSTFAAVTLPVSATNRAQNKNQIYIGSFRPDQSALPRWFGNLKRYQVGIFNGGAELADAQAKPAINPLSGFFSECADSFWSSDSGNYWQSLGITPPPRSQCLGREDKAWSDLPDGPFVEKGGAAQVSRKSDLAARNLLTVSGSGLAAMTNAAAVGGASVFNYLKGTAVGVGETAAASGGRPSIHGDVVHSRPLAIDYGGSTGTYIYYGGNDGLYRSTRASTGLEAWSLIVPEHYAGINRLYNNTPAVLFPNQVETGATAKDYFFDGSTGSVVSFGENDQVDLAWIFPTMRRGGRMVYGVDVTDPSAPSLLWRLGCPALSSDVGCTNGFAEIGQTWSLPTSTQLAGYSDADSNPTVLIFGGGYDNCLDKDQAAYGCGSTPKGRGIYVLDAQSGDLLAGPDTLATEGPVVADVKLVDFDKDGKSDFAYVADAKGGLYRINFATVSEVDDSELEALPPSKWTIDKLAQMSGDKRRFMNAAETLVAGKRIYVGLGSGNRERPLEGNYPYSADVDDRFYMFTDFPLDDVATVIDLDGASLANVTLDPGASGAACSVQGSRGWYTSLDGRGEQTVTPAAMTGGRVLFNTYRPGGSSVGICTRPLGIATGWNMNIFSPSPCDKNRWEETGSGMPIAPVVATVCVGCTAENPENDPDYVVGSVVATGPDGSSEFRDLCINCASGGLKDDYVGSLDGNAGEGEGEGEGGKSCEGGINGLDVTSCPPLNLRRSYFNIDVDR